MTTSVRERPIIFSGPMVKAIPAGKKIVTRRVVKHPGDFLGAGGRTGGEWDDPRMWGWENPRDPGNFIVLSRDPREGDQSVRCPYGQPGDRLWVRETAYIAPPGFGDPDLGDRFDYEGRRRVVGYAATMNGESVRVATEYGIKATPSIHMPRWASRITLEITDIGIERLQEITEDEAIAEGSPPSHPSIDRVSNDYGYPDFSRSYFAQLWDHLNASRGFSWESNPWVWRIAFRMA